MYKIKFKFACFLLFFLFQHFLVDFKIWHNCVRLYHLYEPVHKTPFAYYVCRAQVQIFQRFPLQVQQFVAGFQIPRLNRHFLQRIHSSNKFETPHPTAQRNALHLMTRLETIYIHRVISVKHSSAEIPEAGREKEPRVERAVEHYNGEGR